MELAESALEQAFFSSEDAALQRASLGMSTKRTSLEEENNYHIRFFYNGQETGYATFEVNPTCKEVNVYAFQPTQTQKKKRQGIGTLAHVALLEEIKTILGSGWTDYSRVHSNITPEFTQFLGAIGVKAGKPIPTFLRKLGIPTKQDLVSYHELSLSYCQRKGLSQYL